MASLTELAEKVSACRACPRLVAWREQVAAEKRASFNDWHYWGRPVPGFGDPAARLFVVGLAPAAHGANRTGRMFTGDRSGDWLYRALHRAGYANQPESISRDDGLELSDVYVTSIGKCAPPANKPTAEELANCRPWIDEEFDLLTEMRVIVPLGGLAFNQVMRMLDERGCAVPRPRPRFAHGVEVALAGCGLTVVASYHPSQQNTFTGRLTEDMLDAVFSRARSLISGGTSAGG